MFASAMLGKLRSTLCRAWREEIGVTSLEYALIASLISVGILAALTGVSDQMKNTYYTLIDDAFK